MVYRLKRLELVTDHWKDRLAEVRELLRHPEKLNDDELQALSQELHTLESCLTKDQAEAKGESDE